MQAHVTNIAWLSEAAREAEVTLCSGTARVLSFCHPCELKLGQEVSSPVHAFAAHDIQLAPGREPSIYTLQGLAHSVVGILEDMRQQLGRSCGFVIQLDDHLPGGLQNGDIISFQCGRLDIW
jgi:hypothetical protein